MKPTIISLHGLNNEVHHLGKRERMWYPKWLWERAISN